MATANKLSFVPEQLDLELYGGDGVTLNIQVVDKAQTPVPLTGTLAAQVRRARSDADALEDWQTSVVDPDTGTALISLSGAQTMGLTAGGTKAFKGVWDVQWTADGAEPVTLMQGKLTCVLDVTRV